MKKIISLALVLFCLTTVKAQTSRQDYLYVTSGIKDDYSKGKEIKSGYFLEKIGTESSVTMGNIKRNAQLLYFKKGKETKAFVLTVWDSNNNYNYYCIPTSDADSDIWNMAFSDINAAGKEWHIVFAWALAKVISQKL